MDGDSRFAGWTLMDSDRFTGWTMTQVYRVDDDIRFAGWTMISRLRGGR